MNFYDRPQTLLEHRRHGIFRSLSESEEASGSHARGGWLFFVKSLALALALLCSSEVGAETIKVAYAALSGTQVALWMAKEGGYLSKYGIDAEIIYIPAVAATQ